MTLRYPYAGKGMSRLLVRFGAEQSGNVAILFAAGLVVLLLAIGAAVDLARWMHARDQTAAAIDAALLAGGRALQTNNDDESAAVAAAQMFYAENTKSRLPVTDDSVSFAVTDGGTAMTASGTAYIKTPFLSLANIHRLPLTNLSQTEFSKAELAVGGNGGENLEVSMMLDITGSMCDRAPSSSAQACTSGRKIDALKAAAKDLINIVVWDDQSEFTSKVALVPFSEDIRLPTTAALNAARGTSWPKTKSVGSGANKTTYYLTDCVVERIGTYKYTDDAPGTNKYVTAHYVDEPTTGSGSNKKGVCSVPDSAAVVPLTSDKATLLAKVDGLRGYGGTAGHLGTAWAWYTLSPNWSALWSSSSRPAAYGSENLKKIAILMTDGEFNTQYDSNGIAVDQNKTSNCTKAANGCSMAQAQQLCTAMKRKGIEIYTVLFEQTNQSIIDTMKQCATDPTKYYSASNGEQLKQAFRDIAIKLSSLYLSK